MQVMSSLNFVDINTHQNATYPGSRGVFHFEDKTCDTELRRLLLITKSNNLYSKKKLFLASMKRRNSKTSFILDEVCYLSLTTCSQLFKIIFLRT